MEYIATPDFRMALRVCWAYAWRSVLIGCVIGLVSGVLKAMVGLGAELEAVVDFSGKLLSLVLGVYLLRLVLALNYKRFRMEAVDSQTHQILGLSMVMTLKLWWSWMWRSFLLVLLPMMLIASLAVVMAFRQHMQDSMAHDLCLAEAAKTQGMDGVAQQDSADECDAVYAKKVADSQIFLRLALWGGISLPMMMIAGFLINAKIMQVLMVKRYSNFYMRVGVLKNDQ